MSRLRKYPGDSEERPDDPFADERGRNPFADREELPADAAPVAAGDPYVSGAGGVPTHRVGGFQTTMPHRGGTVLVLGILGLLGTAVFAFCWPMLVINLFLTLPAWLMGQADLRAMKAGAMDPEGRGMTLAGHVMGIAGTLGSVVVFVIVAWMTFRLSW